MMAIGALLALAMASVSAAPGAAARAARSAAISGLAATPYMGWNTYFGLGTVFDEQTVLAEANAMASDGLLAAGYNYVWLDGGWSANPATWPDPDPSLCSQPGADPYNASGCPDGMSYLVAYLHAHGFKAGTYTDLDDNSCMNNTLSAGTDSCGGPAGQYQQTVNQFAAWGFDAVKVDVVGAAPAEQAAGWPPAWPLQHFYDEFSQALQNDSPQRAMVLNLSDWLTPGRDGAPYADSDYSIWSYAPSIASSWRTDTDIGASHRVQWSDVLRNLDADSAHPEAAGPGHWNDPDYLTPQIGSLTASQSQAEFTMWSMLSAPLMIGSDIESLSAGTISMLTNRAVIAIDQDPGGAQAVAYSTGQGQVWVKPLANGDWAVALLNRGDTPVTIDTALAGLGLPARSSYTVANLWQGNQWSTGGSISLSVPAGSATLLRVTPSGSPLGYSCSIPNVPISNSYLCQYGLTGPYTYSNGVQQYWFVAGNHSVWTVFGSGSNWSQNELNTSSVTSGVSMDATTATSASSDGVGVCAQGADATTQGTTVIADVWCDNKGDSADATWTGWYKTGPPGPPVGPSGVNSCSLWGGSYTCEYSITGPHVYPDGSTETWAVAGIPPSTSVWTHTSSGWGPQPGGAGNGFTSPVTLTGTGWGITLCAQISDGKWCDTRGGTASGTWGGWWPVNCTWNGGTYPCGDGVTGPYVFPYVAATGLTQQEYWTVGTGNTVWTYWNDTSGNWHWQQLASFPDQSAVASVQPVGFRSVCASGTGWGLTITATVSTSSGGTVTWYATRSSAQYGSWGPWSTSPPATWGTPDPSC
ncbi:MAG TPA: glycoside hydrolase family 27 protein [Streptosporangiaceae bacterium]|nr:glycoside hydrolase family 27 protein [Streptosporangiaceae bacterium]